MGLTVLIIVIAHYILINLIMICVTKRCPKLGKIAEKQQPVFKILPKKGTKSHFTRQVKLFHSMTPLKCPHFAGSSQLSVDALSLTRLWNEQLTQGN